jgi:aminopeptidase N
MLRAGQFPEDAGPLAHPIRPESYMEISNFYTATIYNKGAEVIRMIALILGPEKFRAGTDLYFDQHDGEAATCEDFVKAMEDASGIDLRQFRLWYSQSGTPRVSASLDHDAATGTATLTLTQTLPETPGQTVKQPMAIPLRLSLFDADGKGTEELVMLDQPNLTLTRPGHADAPFLSINRGFSAPVIVETNRSNTDLAFLSAHDDDPFGRYEAMQQLMVNVLVANIAGEKLDSAPVIDAIRRTLADPALDGAFIAEAVKLPGEAYLGDQMVVVDPDGIHAAREALQSAIGKALEGEWRDLHDKSARNGFSLSPDAKAARRLRNVALNFLVASGASDGPAIAFAQFDGADNMTERQSALATLANGTSDEREAALDIFYNRYSKDALVLDKWFQTQAFAFNPDTVELVAELGRHKDFTLTNPNRVRALYGAFSGNQWAFNRADGKGYRMIADIILEVDAINPQVAARMVPPFGRWRRFDAKRAEMMQAELRRIEETPSLSKDVREQVVKSLV